ncbi:hypothetical protein [Parashewanella tropica]|uniref:hypothetical protein n=1 Tax=Parashewanella tropica TaxID=2547970 RepID=UPI00105A4206|nr:hypothetical protein [Parashewanella tropica]
MFFIRNIILFLLTFVPLTLLAKESFIVSDSFVIPVEKAFPQYIFVKVDPSLSNRDYDALMSARFFIRRRLNTSWPADKFTEEENKVSLANDLIAFNNRTSFTYHILDKAKSKVVGCFYISPAFSDKHDASVFVWVRKAHLETEYFQQIKRDVRRWLKDDWPFEKIDYSWNKT